MSNLSDRNEAQKTVDHAETRAEYRNDCEFLTGDGLRDHLGDRGLDLDVLEREVAGDLIAHEHRDLVEQLAEILRAGLLAAHDGQLVCDQRMVDNVKSTHFFNRCLRRQFIAGMKASFP